MKNVLDGLLDEIDALKEKVKALEAQHPASYYFGAATELTIAGGVITRTRFNHTVDTQGDAGTDDLDTINGGVSGMLLLLQAANDARTVVVKNGTGNIHLPADFSLDSNEDTILLLYNGTAWYQIASSNNG